MAGKTDLVIGFLHERFIHVPIGLILANWQERRALKALRERCPELPQSISGVMAVLITLFGVLALIGALRR